MGVYDEDCNRIYWKKVVSLRWYISPEERKMKSCANYYCPDYKTIKEFSDLFCSKCSQRLTPIKKPEENTPKKVCVAMIMEELDVLEEEYNTMGCVSFGEVTRYIKKRLQKVCG